MQGLMQRLENGFLLGDGAVRNRPEDFLAKRASFSASTWSLLRSLCEIARSSRTLATMTSWPNSCSCSLIHIECVPASMAMRTRGRSVNHLSTLDGFVRNRPGRPLHHLR